MKRTEEDFRFIVANTLIEFLTSKDIQISMDDIILLSEAIKDVVKNAVEEISEEE